MRLLVCPALHPIRRDLDSPGKTLAVSLKLGSNAVYKNIRYGSAIYALCLDLTSGRQRRFLLAVFSLPRRHLYIYILNPQHSHLCNNIIIYTCYMPQTDSLKVLPRGGEGGGHDRRAPQRPPTRRGGCGCCP